jgi:hypothetical protein
MKQKVMAALAILGSTAVGFLIAEAAFRVAMPPVPGDEGSVAEYLDASQRNPGAPRLFPVGYKAMFDIRGLYEGANRVDFEIGPTRFIPPVPPEGAKYKVLFLGGSVTEGIFLNADERWPARLNVPGEVATYNASMSAAGSMAQFITAKYLADRGDRFDLVVLATNQNDATWTRRFREIGSTYDFAHFQKGLPEIYGKEFRAERGSNWTSLRTLAWVRHLFRVARLNATGAPGDPSKNGQASTASAHSIVVDGLVALQAGSNRIPRAPISACQDPGSPKTVTEWAYHDWKENLPEFRRQIKALLGAELLVVSEPAAYGAPSDSFYEHDLRIYPTCQTAQGVRAIEGPDVVALEQERAERFIDAAKSAGAHTFDLAAAMAPYANGPEGGKYFFDSIHPTPIGAQKFAELLKPEILRVLKENR